MVESSMPCQVEAKQSRPRSIGDGCGVEGERDAVADVGDGENGMEILFVFGGHGGGRQWWRCPRGRVRSRLKTKVGDG